MLKRRGYHPEKPYRVTLRDGFAAVVVVVVA